MADELTVAWAALGISTAAFFIALAQALQQYFITGQLIRLCDSVVFGWLPGQGRRIWRMSQFRFRVVYQIPQIGLDPALWPSTAAKSFVRVDNPLPRPSSLDRKGASIPGNIGEASWASFCRAVYPSCHKSIGYSFMQGDAD
ncbi:hypothetical protein B0I35DRAFT_474561 [Stachybotrys elegans]|uniref:Uncharacterized protein n=1 Tax=Stachybotrys elegans TaxID=80388 RepID=A0A8K0T4A5_9HYPO|nr:hypothetical protein B0I35DRAFT_474561 [Stachybotrys elegans]